MPDTTPPSSSSTFQPRTRYPPPTHSDLGASLLKNNDSYNVHFRHPGYPDTNNILLILPALDSSEGGIHHETARIACAIIANCTWEGFLTETRKGRRIAMEGNCLLTLKNYYFHIKEDADDGMYLGLIFRWTAIFYIPTNIEYSQTLNTLSFHPLPTFNSPTIIYHPSGNRISSVFLGLIFYHGRAA
jgi:hypothetical protein